MDLSYNVGDHTRPLLAKQDYYFYVALYCIYSLSLNLLQVVQTFTFQGRNDLRMCTLS